MSVLPVEVYLTRALQANPDRWMSTSEIVRYLPKKIASVRIVGHYLFCMSGENGIERNVDPSTNRRYYRYHAEHVRPQAKG